MKVAKRVCPFFSISSKAYDKHSSNCGSCEHYKLDYKHSIDSPCAIHVTLLEWAKAQ